MPILAKEGGSDFTPHPEGQFRAVCVDVVDLGMVETTWNGNTKMKHRIRIVFQTDAEMDDGKPAMVSQFCTLSLAETSALRPFLQSWRGKAFTPEELNGFDVEKLIGVGAVIQIVHVKKNDKTYANISTIMRLMKGMEPLEARDYVRVIDREPVPATAPQSMDEVPEALEDEDDDLPF
jgi:hypothetical protein